MSELVTSPPQQDNSATDHLNQSPQQPTAPQAFDFKSSPPAASSGGRARANSADQLSNGFSNAFDQNSPKSSDSPRSNILTPDVTPNGKPRRGSLTEYKPRPVPQPSLPPPVVVRRTSLVRRNEPKKDFPRRTSQATPVTISPRNPIRTGEPAPLPRETPDPQPKRGSLNRHSGNTAKPFPRRYTMDYRLSPLGENNPPIKSRLSLSLDEEDLKNPAISSQLAAQEARNSISLQQQQKINNSIQRRSSGSNIPNRGGDIHSSFQEELKRLRDEKFDSDSDSNSDEEENSNTSPNMRRKPESKDSIQPEQWTDDMNLDTLYTDLEICLRGTTVHRLPHSRFGKVKTKQIFLVNLQENTNKSPRKGSIFTQNWNKFALRWIAKKKDASKTQFPLDESNELYIGQVAGRWALKSYQQKFPDSAHLCFTLLRPDQESLDIMCESSKEFECWIRLLKWLCKGDKLRESNIKKYAKATQPNHSPTNRSSNNNHSYSYSLDSDSTIQIE